MISIRARKIIGAYLFLLPALVLVISFEYVPTFSAFYFSMTEYHVLSPAEWTGLDNYKRILDDSLFAKSLWNSFLYFILIVPFLLVVPLLLAILVNQKLRGIYFFRVVYYLPYVTAMVAVAIVWKYVYHPMGLLNAVLSFFGIPTENLNWLLNTRTALPAVSMLEIWKLLGYYMIIYLAGLQSLSHDLIEAARIDGANNPRIFWHVYLPHLRPFIALCLILATIVSVQIFTSVYIMTGGGPLNSTVSLPVYIYQKAFVELDMGYASAMGIVLFAILMMLTMVNYKISRGNAEGA